MITQKDDYIYKIINFQYNKRHRLSVSLTGQGRRAPGLAGAARRRRVQRAGGAVPLLASPVPLARVPPQLSVSFVRRVAPGWIDTNYKIILKERLCATVFYRYFIQYDRHDAAKKRALLFNIKPNKYNKCILEYPYILRK